MLNSIDGVITLILIAFLISLYTLNFIVEKK